MSAKPEDSIFQYLPQSYRRAGTSSATYALTSALGRQLGDFDRQGRRILNARNLNTLTTLLDATNLASLLELTPWSGEDLESFRYRVQQMAPIYMNGAASAAGLLEVAGLACNGQLASLTLPGHVPEGGQVANDATTTSAQFLRRDNVSIAFTTALIDFPVRLVQSQKVLPDAEDAFGWTITNASNNAYDPVIDLVAGSSPLVAPILIQRDLRRFILVNRVIPAGATYRVNLLQLNARDFGGPTTQPGPITVGNGPGPALFYGTGALLDDSQAGQLSGPATRPFQLGKWFPAVVHGDQPLVPGAPGSSDPVPDQLPWPPLVSAQTSNWRLAIAANAKGVPMAKDERVEIATVRTVLWPATTTVPTLNFRWQDQQLPGTFTIAFGDEQGGNWLPTGPVLQAGWLLKQIQRLKLAGVSYIDPNETAL